MEDGIAVDILFRAVSPVVRNHNLISTVGLTVPEPLAGILVEICKDRRHLGAQIMTKIQICIILQIRNTG
jgi:hypothetical protein